MMFGQDYDNQSMSYSSVMILLKISNIVHAKMYQNGFVLMPDRH